MSEETQPTELEILRQKIKLLTEINTHLQKIDTVAIKENAMREAFAFAVFVDKWQDQDEDRHTLLQFEKRENEARYLSFKWNKIFKTFKNNRHNGDCCNVPGTCDRCFVDSCYREADRLIEIYCSPTDWKEEEK